MGPDIRIVPQRPHVTFLAWQLWTRFFDDLQFYLENEPYGWYWRGTDDMFVILDNFVPYFDSLKSSYDPRRDIEGPTPRFFEANFDHEGDRSCQYTFSFIQFSVITP
jgi:hypothetical protein